MPTQATSNGVAHRTPELVEEVFDAQVIRLKRGRMAHFGFEPAWNAYFDFYLSTKYFDKPLLQFEDVTFHLFLRKNLNDNDPEWKMPSVRFIKRQFGMGQDKIEKILERLSNAHLLTKVSGKRRGKKGEDVANEYVLSDPIQSREEFLLVAETEVFNQQLKKEWVDLLVKSRNPLQEVFTPVPKTGTGAVPVLGAPPVPETGALKHTSNKQTSHQQTKAVSPTKKGRNKVELPSTENDVVVLLIQQGISQKVAQRLAGSYHHEHIFEKIDHLNFLQSSHPEKVKSPSGWLRRAIEENYGKPDGFKSKAELEAAESARQRKASELDETKLKIEIEEAQRLQLRRELEQKRLEQWKQKYGTTESELTTWNQVLADLKVHTPEASFTAFLAKTVLLSMKNKTALIGVPSGFAIDWLKKQMTNSFKRKLNVHFKANIDSIDYVSMDTEPYIENQSSLTPEIRPITQMNGTQVH